MKHDDKSASQRGAVFEGRRQVLSLLAGQAVIAPLGMNLVSVSAEEPEIPQYNRFPRMMQEFFVAQARRANQEHSKRLSSLTSKADAEAYVRSAQARCRKSFGPTPAKTPLNPRVTGVVERERYTIEKVIFESRPGFPVTANLYLPRGIDKPIPGVVGTCGHSTNGKASEFYQAFSQGLAKLGYACLIFDPIGQGERLQYPDEELKSTIGVGVREHLYAGNQQFLIDEFFGNWRTWDGIRALDYLLSRPEIDPRHVGVTGNSGGGTMTTWLCGLEPRFSMAAPSCFVSSFRRNLENELPQDTEQCPPNVFPLGIDHLDFLAAMAPKPVIILAKERDYFDVRGSEETFEGLQRLYRLLGAEANVALFVGPTGHGFSLENREAMYSWFGRACDLSADSTGEFDGVLTTRASVNVVDEPEITIEEDATLWCAPDGQVAKLDGTRTVFDFTRDRSVSLRERRKRLSGKALEAQLLEVLKIDARVVEPSATAPDYRNYRFLKANGYPSKFAMAYAVTTEPGIQAIVYRLTEERWHSRPPKKGRRAILYVAHLSSDRELREEPLVREVMKAEPGTPFFTCDVRGIGESRPATSQPDSFHDPYGSDYFYAIHSIMLGRPYLGQKTYDVLRVLNWLASVGHSEVHLVGLEWGALPATFAAILSDTVKQVTLKRALSSYSDVAESEHYNWPLSTLVPGILESLDLPDCYQELASKGLQQVEPRGAS